MISDEELDTRIKKIGKEIREQNKLSDEVKERIIARLDEELKKMQ